MSDRDERAYLLDIWTESGNIAVFTSDVAGLAELKEDRKTLYAVVRSFEIIGEAAKRIDQTTRAKYPSVPWKDMAGMRDKLIHEYSGIDYAILWESICFDIPALRRAFVRIMRDYDIPF